MLRDGAIPITRHDYCLHAIGKVFQVYPRKTSQTKRILLSSEFISKLVNIYFELGCDYFFCSRGVIFCVMPRPRI